MSYINDALRKAQKEKDNRYGRFGEVIVPNIEGPNRPRRRRLVFGSAATLAVLGFAALLFAFYGLPWPSTQPKKASPAGAIAEETPAPKRTETAARPPDGTAKTVAADLRPQPSAQPMGGEAPAANAAEKPAPKETRKALRPPEGSPAMREAELRYQEALTAQRAGDLRRAEELYEKVLALDPEHVKTLNNLGVIHMGQKRREKAISLFGRAVFLKKDYVEPYYNLACLYAQTDQLSESLWYLKVAVAIDGGVINWVKTDADMKNVAASPEFKKLMEGQKN